MDMIEYNICKYDIFYFMENYLNLELRKECIDTLSKCFSYNYVESAGDRRSGQTTINLVYALWQLLFIPNTCIIVICGDIEKSTYYANQLLDLHRTCIMKQTIINIPPMTRQSRTNFAFRNGSRILFNNTNMESIRGFRFDTVILENIKSTNYEFYLKSLNNLIPNTKLTIISDTY